MSAERLAAAEAKDLETWNEAARALNVCVVCRKEAPTTAQNVVERKDDEIVKDVESRLKTDPSLKKASIAVRSDNGIVTLTGDVPSLKMSLRASEKARQVAGVHAVRNELTVKEQK
jgi:osmotically-inducible protein OsmY